MAILMFSLVALFGFIPAIFVLDRLYAIDFAQAAKKRASNKDVF